MANTRVTREVENREFSERPKQWMNPELLPEPDKEVGFSYRWVRVSMMGQHDARNLSSKLREGYEPVRIEEQPKFRLLVDPTSRYKDNIEIAGLLLCKIPEEFLEQRKAFFDGQTRQQTEAVDNNFMRQSDARMPLFRERKSTTSLGKN